MPVLSLPSPTHMIFARFQHFLPESSQTAQAARITFVQVNMKWGLLRWLGSSHDTDVNGPRCLSGWCF